MRLGIYGRPGSGRRTVYQALGQGLKAPDEKVRAKKSGQQTVVLVPDQRLAPLGDMFKPKKITPTRLTFFLPDETAGQAQVLADLSSAEGLVLVLGNFENPPGSPQDPAKDLRALEEELILRDLAVAEGRLERLNKGRHKGLDFPPQEPGLLEEVLGLLNQGRSLKERPDLAGAEVFKSFAFLSAKPRLVVVNNAEGDPERPELDLDQGEFLVLQGQIEKELAQMAPQEAQEFRAEYGLQEPGVDRMARAAYGILDLISFFTVGQDEVKAWSLPQGAAALQAAGAIHTDLEKGFIRAEVIPAGDLIAAGSLAEARKKGLVRLEGRDYVLADGDVVTIRFNV
ncbi:MAG: redox-regulated ATPase YchF [Deltaproteobacteria bacterium]|nr:redox-regulated ATPase YchF [Deltaproteobacteria bacterium]